MATLERVSSKSTVRLYDLRKDGRIAAGGDATSKLDTVLANGDSVLVTDTFLFDQSANLTLATTGQEIRGLGRGKAWLIPTSRSNSTPWLTVDADHCAVEKLQLGPAYVLTTLQGVHTFGSGATVTTFGTGNFPASGTCVIKGDQVTNRPCSFSYTGKNSTQLTGVTWISGSGSFAGGTTVQLVSTAGNGILLNSGEDAFVDGCIIQNAYDGFVCGGGYTYQLTRFRINDPTRYAVREQDVGPLGPDLGDSSISNGTIKAITQATAFRFESGGGMKVSCVKVFGCDRHIDVQAQAAVATSIIMFAGNSMEGCNVENIRIGDFDATGGTWDMISIDSSNQFQTPKVCDRAVHLGIGTSELHIGATFRAAGGSTFDGIYVESGTNRSIAPVVLQNYAVGVHIGSSAQRTKVDLSRTTMLTVAAPYQNDTSPAGNVQDTISGRFYLQIDGITSAVTYQNGWKLDMNTFDSVAFRVNFAGRLTAAIDGFCRTMLVHVDRQGGNCVCTTKADDTVGAPIDVNLDVSTTAGSVYIQLRRNSGDGGTALWGAAELEIVAGRLVKLNNPTSVGSGKFQL